VTGGGVLDPVVVVVGSGAPLLVKLSTEDGANGLLIIFHVAPELTLVCREDPDNHIDVDENEMPVKDPPPAIVTDTQVTPASTLFNKPPLWAIQPTVGDVNVT